MLRRFFTLGLVFCTVLAARCGTDLRPSVTQTGEKALSWTRELTDLGPRPPGSAGLENARLWIEEKVREAGLELVRDRFTAETPIGDIGMENLSVLIPGLPEGPKALLMAHYESKRFLGFDFVGANDSAASVALLLALIPRIRALDLRFDTELVFLDGEEAVVSWTPKDSLYGSRHLAGKIGDTPIRAAIVLDMVGDADLQLIRESRNDTVLTAMVEDSLRRRGLLHMLSDSVMNVEDDHAPLAALGIPVMLLMDFTYGGKPPPGPYWHTAADTVDKLSGGSLSLIGDLVIDVLVGLDSRVTPPRRDSR